MVLAVVNPKLEPATSELPSLQDQLRKRIRLKFFKSRVQRGRVKVALLWIIHSFTCVNRKKQLNKGNIGGVYY